MESVDLAMDDIFDGGLAEEDLAIPPPLPDLDDDMPVGGEDGGALNTSMCFSTSISLSVKFP